MMTGLQNQTGLTSNSTTTQEAIKDAQLLLAHAATHGIGLKEELVTIIVSAKKLLSANLDDPTTFEQQTAFWMARDALANAINPVTASSLKASAYTGPSVPFRYIRSIFTRSNRPAISAAEQSVLLFRLLAFVALFFLLVVQVYYVVGTGVLSDTNDIFKKSEEIAAKLATVSENESLVAQLEATQTNLNKEMQLRFGVLEHWNSMWKAPLGIFGLREGSKVESPGFHDLQRARLTARFATEAIERYFLPLLYGLLGACLYVLRKLSHEVKTLSFTPEQGVVYSLRVYMGMLSGLVVVWLLPVLPSDGGLKSLSVFAVAFLVGYCIELLFAFMDKIILAFTSSRND